MKICNASKQATLVNVKEVVDNDEFKRHLLPTTAAYTLNASCPRENFRTIPISQASAFLAHGITCRFGFVAKEHKMIMSAYGSLYLLTAG